MRTKDGAGPSSPEESKPEFDVVVSASHEGTVVVPRGELDLATGPGLEAVLAAQSGPVVLDMRELSFVDASGLRVLLEAETRSRQNGNNLSFIAGRAVRRLFEIADLSDPLTYIEPPSA